MSGRRENLSHDQIAEILQLDSFSDTEQLSDMEDNEETESHLGSEFGQSSDEDIDDEAIAVAVDEAIVMDVSHLEEFPRELETPNRAVSINPVMLFQDAVPLPNPPVDAYVVPVHAGPSSAPDYRPYNSDSDPDSPMPMAVDEEDEGEAPMAVDHVRGAGRRGRPRSLRVRGRPRSGPRQRRVAPAPCVQCFYEKHIRKITRLMCCKCSECPGLCSSYCFQRYHQRMHPEMYQARLPTITLSSAIRLRQGLKFDRNHSNSY